ncbi:MAG TPA: (2Fe-2S) ferredoxin domain-containing protein [Firmicutes bacterium]|jgi:NADH:ubiquinone oxidoreductase subunit E|nr:(2Fe-2S) ferredoxin domain-containing protein [Bacillota bacterium]HHV94418.1 (2Fe-2S) ferredoxin domain-containing protein [Bacillota bacterium]
MLTIAVCVGSSCHLRGSYEVISRFQALIRRWELQELVELKGVFCMNHCTGEVSVRIDDGPVIAVSVDGVEEVFRQEILPRLGVS